MKILKQVVWRWAFRKTTVNRDQVQVGTLKRQRPRDLNQQSKIHSEFQVLISSEAPPTQRGESPKKEKILVTEKERIKAQELSNTGT